MTGTLTFLFTDIEGSTRLWQEDEVRMRAVMAAHDGLAAEVVERHRGRVFKQTGDGVAAVFASAVDAIVASVELARALNGEDPALPIKARLGVHTGEAEARGDDFFGGTVNRAARLMGVAHGGQVVVSQATMDLARDGLPAGVSLQDLGEHRLRDLSRPERVFQVMADGLRSGFPPLRSLDSRAGNLPVQLTTFVGRSTEVERICTTLGTARIVTLTGVGGVGKTRLAVHVAAEAVPNFDDGAWLCELAAASDADTMVQLVAATLGVPPRPGVDLAGAVVEYLRHRTLLLILDNCEHLLDPAGRLAEAVARGCPTVRVLATSREALAVEGEQVWPLRSLSVSGTGGDGDAVRLFADRAVAARPGLVLEGAYLDAATELCRRLDGIPLAIELAAARAVAMTPAEIAEHLDERFRLLTGGRRTAVERHQTLRATVDWSYSLLGTVDQRVFERLAVFSGTFDAAAARSVAADDGIEAWDVLDALGSLVAKSMLTADDVPTGETRYGMLETLRQYARERLDETGDADRWRRRHAEYFAAFAEMIGPATWGPEEFASRARLLADLDNVRAAFTWGLDRGEDGDVELALRVLAGVGWEAQLNRRLGVCAWAVRALPLVRQVAPGLRTAVYTLASWDAIRRGQNDRAREVALQGVEAGCDHTVPTAVGLWSAIGLVATSRGDLEEMRWAMAEARESVALLDSVHKSVIHSVRAMLEVGSGHAGEARPVAEEALVEARASGNPTALSMALYATAWATEEVDPLRARAAYEESIDLRRQGASGAVGPAALVRVAPLRLGAGDRMGAIDALVEALVWSRDIGDHLEAAFAAILTASVLGDLGRLHEMAEVMGIVDGAVIAPAFPHDPVLARVRTLAREQAREAAFAECHAARGASMDYDSAMSFLLAVLGKAGARLTEGSLRLT